MSAPKGDFFDKKDIESIKSENAGQSPGIRASDLFKSKDYNKGMKNAKDAIDKKIINMNNKIATLNMQAEFMEKNIKGKQDFLVSMDQNNLTAIRKIENSIIFNMEINSKIYDNIIKFEQLVQSYTKFLMDIENNKLTAYKTIESLNKEANASNKDFLDIARKIHDKFNEANGGGSNIGPSGEQISNVDIMNQALNELTGKGYAASLKTPEQIASATEAAKQTH